MSGYKKSLLEALKKPLSEVDYDVGKHNDVPDSEFDADQLRMGIKIEMEHTDDPEMSKCIAKDHLTEIPDYYTRLIKMEEDYEKSK